MILVGGYGPNPLLYELDDEDPETGKYRDIFIRYSDIYEAALPTAKEQEQLDIDIQRISLDGQ